jgi:hypothetical protein
MHRLVKHALDSGEAATIAEAEDRFAGYRLALRLDKALALNPHHQAALLTAVAIARRVFLGGVTVAVPSDVPLLAPLPLEGNLSDAIVALGASIASAHGGVPLIDIGGSPCARQGAFHVRVLFAGWRGGIIPADSEEVAAPGPVMALTPMLAAALAINEAFLFVSARAPMAGRRSVGLSLWDLSSRDWLSKTGEEPDLRLLPSRLWLIGLGHLGQAYLWALGLLPYVEPSQVELILQDVDVITPSTESTSILSSAALIGQKKTRAMAAWAERRGFGTAIHERLFDNSLRRQPDEPAIALCGVDNSLGRRALDEVGFDFVVEAGLGRGHVDFRAIRLHTLPASRSATRIWQTDSAPHEAQIQSAYTDMLARGELDLCGVTLLAGKAVGAPFVGAVAATLAVCEILRLLHGGAVHELIDLDLKAPEYRVAVATCNDFRALNPGFLSAL